MRRHDRGAFARWPAVLAVTGPQKGPTDGGVVCFFFSHQNTSGGSTDNRPVMAGLLLVSLRFVEPEDHVWCVEPPPLRRWYGGTTPVARRLDRVCH